jgi:hypothetical protein
MPAARRRGVTSPSVAGALDTMSISPSSFMSERGPDDTAAHPCRPPVAVRALCRPRCPRWLAAEGKHMQTAADGPLRHCRVRRHGAGRMRLAPRSGGPPRRSWPFHGQYRRRDRVQAPGRPGAQGFRAEGTEPASALVPGGVPACSGPGQCLEGVVEPGLVALDGEDVVRAEVLAGQRGEGTLGVECVCRQDPPGEGEPGVQLQQLAPIVLITRLAALAETVAGLRQAQQRAAQAAGALRAAEHLHTAAAGPVPARWAPSRPLSHGSAR